MSGTDLEAVAAKLFNLILNGSELRFMTFPIRLVNSRRAQIVEPLGSKPKFWFREGNSRLLFKAESRGTGEDWAEVVAAHLCGLIGLPHVEYQLATDVGRAPGSPGVVCANMSPPPSSLVLGNQLLLAVDPTYPSAQRFKVKLHTIDAVCRVLRIILEPSAEWMSHVPSGIKSALDVFVGYVMFDAWIANQDRHHENWGAIWSGPEHSQRLHLAPTFDHGAGLARNLADSERKDRLSTTDSRRTVAAFAARGRSAFYDSPEAARPLLLLEAFEQFAVHSPLATSLWLHQLRAVPRDAISAILELVPAERMSSVCRNFTLELLEVNRQRLLGTGKST